MKNNPLKQIDQFFKSAIFIISVIIFSVIVSYLVVAYSGLSLLLIPILIIAYVIIYYFTKNPFVGFLFVIFFLPFERIPSLDVGLVTLKINQFLGGLLIISWLLSKLFYRKKFTSNALIWPLVLFLTVAFISIFNAVFVSRAVSVFIFIIFTALLFVVTVDLVDSKERFKIIIKVLLYSTLITCFFSLFQFMADIVGLPKTITGLKEGYGKETLGFPRVQAFSQEPLYLGNFLFIPLGIFSGLYFEKINFISRKWLLFVIGLVLLIMILTVSRGAYLGLVIFVIVFGLLEARKVFSIKHIIIGVVTISLVLGMTVFFLQKSTPEAYEKFIGHATLDDLGVGQSTEARLDAYYDAYDAFLEQPYFGIGLGNFGPWVKGYPDPSTVEGWDIVNNEYLEVLAETGIFGFLTYISFLLVLVIRSFIAFFRVKDNFLRGLLVGLMAATAAVLVQYNFFSTLYIIHIWILMGLLVAVQNIILGTVKSSTKKSLKKD